jgi:hypothetical protein
LSLATSALAADDLRSAFQEGTVKGEFRNYYFRRGFDVKTTREDVASGGMLYYRTAPLYGISCGVGFYTSHGMGFNDTDEDTYGLLAQDHEHYDVLGESYIQGVRWETTLKVGRQELRTPWINIYDIRFTPQSTESYTLFNKSITGLEIFSSHVTKIRGRTSTEFVSMTEFAGITADDEPVTVGGLIYTGLAGLKLQLWDFYGYDFLNNFYVRGDYSRKVSEKFSLFGAFQYLDQHDVDDSLGGSIDTGNYAVMAGIKAYGAKLSLAVADNGDDDIFFAWGHDFIINTPVYRSFRAEETSIQAILRYDFSKIGIEGLDGKAAVTDFNTPESGTNSSPDRESLDLELKYKFDGYLKGLSLKWRLGFYNLDDDLGGDDVKDLRIYVKYVF